MTNPFGDGQRACRAADHVSCFGSAWDGGGFSEVEPNPNGSNLEAGLNVFHDGVVAFGGGSRMDLGKLIATMAGQTRPVWNFEDVGEQWTLADADAIRPVVAVPTTAGTVSEAGRASVLTNECSHERKIIFHPRMLPVAVIVDPELTKTRGR